jgi:hypothetical protein
MRHELTDGEWSVIKPMLPNKPRGVPRVDDRQTLNGIFWHGAICRSATDPIPAATIDSSAGGRPACGTGSWPPFQQHKTQLCR